VQTNLSRRSAIRKVTADVAAVAVISKLSPALAVGKPTAMKLRSYIYPRIMQAILDTGFKGYVAQEFVPKRPDALASLRQGVRICEV
jgi:hypothetical protein